MIIQILSVLTLLVLGGGATATFLPRYRYQGEHRADDRAGLTVAAFHPTEPIPMVRPAVLD